MNDPVAPIPFPRGSVKPLRVSIDPPADGYSGKVTITVTNDLLEAFPACRVAVLMPAGQYICGGGKIELAVSSDCKRFTRLTLRTDVPPENQKVLTLSKITND
jgi:hypothetical protein